MVVPQWMVDIEITTDQCCVAYSFHGEERVRVILVVSAGNAVAGV